MEKKIEVNIYIPSDQPKLPADGKVRTLEETGISNKWKPLASFWLGNSAGEHCHWCKHVDLDRYEGEAYCGLKNTKFPGRIRTWDGEDCARNCKHFRLGDWYKHDKNYDEYFKKDK